MSFSGTRVIQILAFWQADNQQHLTVAYPAGPPRQDCATFHAIGSEGLSYGLGMFSVYATQHLFIVLRRVSRRLEALSVSACHHVSKGIFTLFTLGAMVA